MPAYKQKHQGNSSILGKRKRLDSSLETAECYHETAVSNRESADVLFDKRLYNEAAYMYIQAMEKFVKEQICRKVNVTLPYFAKKMLEIGHHLDKSVEFLIEIYSGSNITLKEQLTQQLVKGVLHEMRFSSVHNDLRYPHYYSRYDNYSFLTYSQADCEKLKNMTNSLIEFMNNLYRI